MIHWFRFSGVLVSLLLATASLAAPPSLPGGGGALLREIERSTGQQAPAPAPLVPEKSPPPEAPLPEKTGQTVFVTSFQIKATRFPAEELLGLLKGYVGRALTLAELQEAARTIGDYYHQHDYLAHAYLPPQTVHNGVVEITVVEGRLGQIKVDPSSTTRLDQQFAIDLVRARAGLTPSDPLLHPLTLDGAVMILNEVPGVRATSTLSPGANESESISVLKIEDGPLVSGSLTLDRAGSQATGADRALLSASVDDPLGHGEQFSLSALKTSGSTYTRLATTMPVGVSGLTLGVNGTALDYKVGGASAAADPNGYVWSLGMTAAYPILRSAVFSLTASATLDHKRMVDWAAHTVSDDKRIDVGTLGLSATSKDHGGTNHFGVTLSFGQFNLSQGTSNPRTLGVFEKAVLTAGRDQPIVEKITLSLNLQVQAARPNLDSSEKFSLGGPDGIRAYPASEASGDDGWMSNLALQWQATEKAQFFTFYDVGWIRQNNHLWENWRGFAPPDQPNEYGLQGAGIGVNWSPFSNLQIKATLAHTVHGNPGHALTGDDSDGKHKKMRGWLQAILSF